MMLPNKAKKMVTVNESTAYLIIKESCQKKPLTTFAKRSCLLYRMRGLNNLAKLDLDKMPFQRHSPVINFGGFKGLMACDKCLSTSPSPPLAAVVSFATDLGCQLGGLNNEIPPTRKIGHTSKLRETTHTKS